MVNDGWFKYDKCGHTLKVLVQDHVRILEEKCEKCGGTMRKT